MNERLKAPSQIPAEPSRAVGPGEGASLSERKPIAKPRSIRIVEFDAESGEARNIGR